MWQVSFDPPTILAKLGDVEAAKKRRAVGTFDDGRLPGWKQPGEGESGTVEYIVEHGDCLTGV